MNKIIGSLFILLAIASCSGGDSNTVLNADEFNSKITSGATLLDVRTPDEYSSGHIANSINMDIKNESFEENLSLLDKSKTYAVYCASGVRSGKAADIMKEKGFTSVYTLEGGIKTWKEKDLPLE